MCNTLPNNNPTCRTSRVEASYDQYFTSEHEFRHSPFNRQHDWSSHHNYDYSDEDFNTQAFVRRATGYIKPTNDRRFPLPRPNYY